MICDEVMCDTPYGADGRNSAVLYQGLGKRLAYTGRGAGVGGGGDSEALLLVYSGAREPNQ